MESLSAETRSEIYEKLWTRMPRLNPGPMASFRIDDFISLIKGLPIIYNRLDKHNKQEYIDTWDRLEAILKTPKKFLMMKWKGLRDNFRVELKKEYFSPPENRYVSKWVHYKKLAFLREQVLATLDQKLDSDSHDELREIMQFVQSATHEVPPTVESRANEHSYANSDIDPRELKHVKEEREDSRDGGDDDASDEGDFYFSHFQEPDQELRRRNHLPEITITPKLTPAPTPPMNLQQPRKRPSVSFQESPAAPPAKIPARTSPSSPEIPRDDDYHFLMSIHPYLKQLPLPVKLKVRLQMQQVLFNELMKQPPIIDEED